MKKKYYNDAFIGNNNITASFSKYGELLRLYYPCPDYRQYSDFLHIGLRINNSNIFYLHDDINNTYKQYYTDDTNILNTEIVNQYFKINILQTDFAMIRKDVMIRKFVLKNENDIDLNINLLAHSKLISSYNNMVGGLITNDALIQYSHNFCFCILGKQRFLSHQVNNVDKTISSGYVYDKDYIGMSPDSAISYDLGTLKPQEETEFSLLIYMEYDKWEMNKNNEIINEIKNIDIDKELEKVEKYWKDFVAQHDTLKLKKDGNEYKSKIIDIYRRTILFMPLLINKKTGGVSATLEVDEDSDQSGRYSYCWPRDAVIIYSAFDYLNFDNYSKDFYLKFLHQTQSENGMWEQRFYTDGKLAPCWGYQIDETALVIWGAYEHYKIEKEKDGKKDKEFLKENLRMLEKAMDFIERYICFVLGKEISPEDIVLKSLKEEYNYNNRDEIYKHTSYDLWEMNEGVHLFSISSIYGAFSSMIKIYEELYDSFDNNRLKQNDIILAKVRYEDYKRSIKDYILKNLYDKQKQVLVRNTKDRKMDISVLGAVIPFEVFDIDDKIITNTIELITMTLKTYADGYLRFQGDTYVGGNYPWIIATAWMGLYYKKIGNLRETENCLRFIVNSSTNLNLLPEQASNDFKDRWVIGLGWSHAMFIKMLLD